MEMGRDCESHAGSMWVGLAALCVACAAALSGGLGCAGTVQEGPELESGGAGAVPGDMLTVESLELDEGQRERAGQLEVGQVLLRTSLGDVLLELATEQAPLSGDNFLRYVEEGFYDGRDGRGRTIFHRVIQGFMVQGGGLLTGGSEKPTHAPIVNESSNGLENVRGALAMARTDDPDSATSQFYINTVDNPFLDPSDPGAPAYTVFGRVVEGMEVVDDIEQQSTNAQDRPSQDVTIEEALRWLQ